MKQIHKGLCALFFVMSTMSTFAATSHYRIRSQSFTAMRDLVGWQKYIHRCDADGQSYGAFAFTGQYEQSFGADNIARCIFGNDVGCEDRCPPCLTISGSRRQDREETDWLGDYFGVSPDFKSDICLNPKIRSFNGDFSFYFGLDSLYEGMFFRFHIPLTYTKWELDARETVKDLGDQGYVAGYFSSAAVAKSNLLNKALDFLSGEKVATINPNNGTTIQKLTCSKFSGLCGSKTTEVRISDIEAQLGWNVLCAEDSHLGLSLRLSAPTGNTPTGEYLLEPIVGSGKHWKVGGGLNAHYMFWQSDDEDRSFGMWLDGTVWHLFNTGCQTRCFDLCGKPNSRYMLAMKIGTPVQNLLGNTTAGVATGTAPSAQFQNEFAPVANLTRSNVKVDVRIEGNVALKFGYRTGNSTFDFGYEYWGRGCERICVLSSCEENALDGSSWALKGDAHVYGFGTANAPIALSATNSDATINGGTNRTRAALNATGTANATSNPTIDNAQFAADGTNIILAATGGAQTRTSVDPVFITEELVNYAGTKGSSHRVFAHWSYAWDSDEDWTTFFGVGGSAEINPSGGCCDDVCQNECEDDCGVITGCGSCDTCCPDCAPSMWSFWLKGGVAFD